MNDLTTYALDLTQMTWDELQNEYAKRQRLIKQYAQWNNRACKSRYFAHLRRRNMVQLEIAKRSRPPYIRGVEPRD